MNKSYSVLATYYDKISANDCNYDGWASYLQTVAQKHNVKKIVDLACGTGKMTKRLNAFGYDVIGIDSSAEMLTEAQSSCRCKFVLQDMTKLRLTKTVDMAVCVNDGINYLTASGLTDFFRSVSGALNSGSPFVFDFSTDYKLQQVIANNIFYYDTDELTLLWCNKLNQNFVKMDLTLFERQKDGKYIRQDESHTQYIYSLKQVVNCLGECGFDVKETSCDYGKKIQPNSLRLTIYAVKR